ncbi:hypothetical protein niasHT_028221 [Heterodera trifolii]|uniref:F-box associated domain-containing protein n=1 Tax=Heterodera trifolii TaxID=157864 RepID=A0ABD2K925_9BILA
MDELGMDELGMDDLGMDELGMDDLGMDELGMDKLGMDDLGMDDLGMDELGMDDLGMDDLGMDELGMDDLGMDELGIWMSWHNDNNKDADEEFGEEHIIINFELLKERQRNERSSRQKRPQTSPRAIKTTANTASGGGEAINRRRDVCCHGLRQRTQLHDATSQKILDNVDCVDPLAFVIPDKLRIKIGEDTVLYDSRAVRIGEKEVVLVFGSERTLDILSQNSGTLCAVTLLLASCGSILWFFSDHVKKRRRPPKKEIFISADCWLLVFDFLTPSQLGLEIAMISRRFDLRVDEHFKTRKWALTKRLIIQWDIEENGTKKMQIVKSDGNPLPIPQEPLPNKVIGISGQIRIMYIDQNVLTFLRHFHHSFAATYTVYLDIITEDIRILEFVLHNIWPLFRDSIRSFFLNAIAFRHMCQLAPTMLTDCPSLRLVDFDDAIFSEFLLPDDNAIIASDGETVAKWLFKPRPDGGSKWLQCHVDLSVDQWTASMEQLGTAFSIASSPVTFHIYLTLSSSLIGSVVEFDLINEVTGEQLVLEEYGTDEYGLSRCSIEWDWQNLENEWKELCAARPQRISIWIRDSQFDEGLLDAASPGSSALTKWLHTPSKDGQPKKLRYYNPLGPLNLEWVNNFKETFRRAATTSVSYHIQLYFHMEPTPIEQFELVNERTKEKLTLKQKTEASSNEIIYNWLLQRCPIGETATVPAIKWEDCEKPSANLNNINFELWSFDKSIGPLSPPAEEKKEEDEADQNNGNE